MAGGIAFDRGKFLALAEYVADELDAKSPFATCSTRLAAVMWHSDMDAFRCLGQPLTGATWCKGREMIYCREMGEDWMSRFILSRQPWYARVLGWALALVAVIAAR